MLEKSGHAESTDVDGGVPSPQQPPDWYTDFSCPQVTASCASAGATRKKTLSDDILFFS